MRHFWGFCLALQLLVFSSVVSADPYAETTGSGIRGSSDGSEAVSNLTISGFISGGVVLVAFPLGMTFIPAGTVGGAEAAANLALGGALTLGVGAGATYATLATKSEHKVLDYRAQQSIAFLADESAEIDAEFSAFLSDWRQQIDRVAPGKHYKFTDHELAQLLVRVQQRVHALTAQQPL